MTVCNGATCGTVLDLLDISHNPQAPCSLPDSAFMAIQRARHMQEQPDHDKDTRGDLGVGHHAADDTMATLGRSLKSPVYLSRASSSSNGSRRPALAARTFSHSSDISAASANSWADDHLDIGVMSGLNTPALEKTVTESLAAKESRPPQKEVKGHSQVQAKSVLHTSAASPFDLNLNAIESSSSRALLKHHRNLYPHVETFLVVTFLFTKTQPLEFIVLTLSPEPGNLDSNELFPILSPLSYLLQLVPQICPP
ncbi:hypothetical protein HYQ44_014666 [Verticillium longisporum]|nr:hypothetical protein HYQ44_014666 [Verticillium longisporum]